MEMYESPVVEIVMIDAQDVITASCPQENICEVETEPA